MMPALRLALDSGVEMVSTSSLAAILAPRLPQVVEAGDDREHEGDCHHCPVQPENPVTDDGIQRHEEQ